MSTAAGARGLGCGAYSWCVRETTVRPRLASAGSRGVVFHHGPAVTVRAGDDVVTVALVASPDEDSTVHVELTVVATLPGGTATSATAWLTDSEAVKLTVALEATAWEVSDST